MAYHAACSLQHGQKLTGVPKALLQKAGFTVKQDMPLLRGEKVQALYAAGARWLRGEPHGWAG